MLKSSVIIKSRKTKNYYLFRDIDLDSKTTKKQRPDYHRSLDSGYHRGTGGRSEM